MGQADCSNLKREREILRVAVRKKRKKTINKDIEATLTSLLKQRVIKFMMMLMIQTLYLWKVMNRMKKSVTETFS
jgi:hypothetical protein